MDSTTGMLVAAIMTPIISAIVGLIVSRSGTAEKVRRVEYFLKRIELIEKLLSLPSNQINEYKFPVAPLIDELNDIADSIQQSSIRQQAQSQFDFDQRPLWKRIYKLPRPQTVGGWIGSGIFYLYSFTALIYIGTLFWGAKTLDLPAEFALSGALGSALFAWFGRIWAVKSARRATTRSKADFTK